MRQVTSATFRDTFVALTEPVEVRRYNTLLGVWYPAGVENMPDEPVRKAIEQDQVKKEPRGRISKGLGDIPGVTNRDPYQEFRPAPKPKK